MRDEQNQKQEQNHPAPFTTALPASPPPQQPPVTTAATASQRHRIEYREHHIALGSRNFGGPHTTSSSQASLAWLLPTRMMMSAGPKTLRQLLRALARLVAWSSSF